MQYFMTMNKAPLFEAVKIAGGQVHLARLIGVSQGHLWCWLHRDKALHPKRALDIEAATGGKITRYQLCPDVFGPDQAQAQAHQVEDVAA